MNHWCLIFIFVISEMSTGLQSLPFFTFLFCPVLLVYTRLTWKNSLYAFLVNLVAVSVATLGSFDVVYGTPRLTHLPEVLFHACMKNLILLTSTLFDRLAFSHKSSSLAARVLLFPCIWTALWHVYAAHWGDQESYAVSISDWKEWAQVVDLGGRAVLDWMLALFATCLLEYDSWLKLAYLTLSSRPIPIYSSSSPKSSSPPPSTKETRLSRSKLQLQLIKHPLSLYLVLVTFVYIYGGIKSTIRPGSYFQQPCKDWVPASIPVACVVGPGGFNTELRSDYDYWMNKSVVAAQHGAKLVLWSEEVVDVPTLEEEERLRSMAIKVAVEKQIYIVITYDRHIPVNHNMAVLISPQGDILIDYVKANPVPYGENNIPGPGTLLYADTPEFGRIGLAICFDLSVPSFIRQAGQNNIDILLQPAYNWGAGGDVNLRNQQLRPIENGFTLFRCISQGISGVIEPVIHGHYEQKNYVISNQINHFNLPIQKHTKTSYSAIGDVFPRGCAVVCAVLLTHLLF